MTDLHYLVIDGTNDRVLNRNKEPLIVESRSLSDQIAKWEDITGETIESIPVLDFKTRFKVEVAA